MPRQRLSETDICDRFITPALHRAGWLREQILREHSFTAGRITVRGRLVARGKPRGADDVLLVGQVAVAVIEAKHNSHAVGDGLEQPLAYAKALHTPFVFANNGDGFVLHDKTDQSEEREMPLSLEAFPGPEELWRRYCRWKGLSDDEQRVAVQPYWEGSNRKEPRYYQRNAIQEVVEAIAKGRHRLLLVMATGTGKTFVAFQIIWRLWKAKRTKRVLFLADRNVLVNQTMTNDFRPFGGAMAKLSTSSNTIEKADGSVEELSLALDRNGDGVACESLR